MLVVSCILGAQISHHYHEEVVDELELTSLNQVCHHILVKESFQGYEALLLRFGQRLGPLWILANWVKEVRIVEQDLLQG